MLLPRFLDRLYDIKRIVPGLCLMKPWWCSSVCGNFDVLLNRSLSIFVGTCVKGFRDL